jgi:signal transduction histidine kinase
MGFDVSDRRALGQLISAQADEIELRWLEQVRSDIVGRRDVHPTQLRDGIPDYLTALSGLLACDGDRLDKNGTATWVRVARQHGLARVQVGFDIDQLIREFIALRHVIQSVAREHGVKTDPADAMLADLIDAAIAEAVRAYVRARDDEARRIQAENIGFVTHELRNPLAAVVQAEAAIRAVAVPEQQRALDILERGHRRLTELIDSVLDSERLEGQAMAPKPTEIHSHDLIEAATTVARKTAQDKGVQLVVDDGPDCTLMLDRNLTCSAIQNLVDNAVKYTDDGHVDVVVEDQSERWSVHVRDTGPGLSPGELRTIFEPCRRGETSKQGTGLGLAIARRAIEAQGGTIHAESTNAGSHFWITLPKS